MERSREPARTQNSAITDLDELRFEWHPELGRRAFEFDAFLSHNRSDGSGLLAEWLESRGLRVWHDRDVPVFDRNVQQRLRQALRHSRYVVVCVGPGFRESEWCGAEFIPALDMGARAIATRVVIARLADNAPIPPKLADCPSFGADPIGRQSLLQFLTEGNRLPFDPQLLVQASLGRDSLITDDRRSDVREDDSAITTPFSGLSLTVILKSLSLFETPETMETISKLDWAMDALAGMLQPDEYSQFRVDGAARDMLLRAARLCLTSPEYSTRHNAFVALAHLAATDETWQGFAALLDACIRERNVSALLGVPHVLFRGASRLPDWLLDSFQYLVLRTGGSRLAEKKPLFRQLHETLRMRVVLQQTAFDRIIDVDRVGAMDRVRIVEQRLQQLFDHANSVSSGSPRPILSALEVETALTDLVVLSRRYANEEPDLQAGLLRVFEVLVTESERMSGGPFVLKSFEIADWFLLLLDCRADARLREHVHELYMRACKVVSDHSPRRQAVPALLELLRRTEAGEDERAARTSFQLEYIDILDAQPIAD